MKIKCMHAFEGIKSFNQFSDYLEIENWRIEKQLLKERVEKYGENIHFLQLKEDFKNNKLTIWDLKDEEVITWMDTSLLMRRLLLELFKKGIDANNINIAMEYPLVFGNHMRSDYLLIYNRLIVVLEFGMFNQDEKRSEERYTKKLQESINYRQILSNMISEDVKVINYVMIYKPEYDRFINKTIEDNITYNKEELQLLSKFMIHNIRREDLLSAKSQLEMIESIK